MEYSDTVDFRGMELDVENLLESRCRNCGNKWVSDEQRAHNNSVMREAYIVVRDEIRAKDGLLTGQEIAQVRERFGINQREAATIFGGGYNAFNKYESGEVLQSFAMDRLVRLTSAVGTPAIEFLRNVFATPNFIVISAPQGTTAVISVHVETRYLEAGKYIPTVFGTNTQLENQLPTTPFVIWGQLNQVPQQLAHNHH
jgi:putative zinc finger/helix-turn-helix YgiT family protein